MRHILIFIIAIGIESGFAQTDSESWVKVSAQQVNGEMFYVGSSVNETSEALAIQVAERDAITQMIRHYFGIKLNYSLATTESLNQVSLTIESQEKSETLNLQGLLRTNIKLTDSKSGGYSAFVQIAVPIKSLKTEKARLEKERKLAEVEKAQRIERAKAAPKPKAPRRENAVPLIYLGMPRQVFVSYYPGPETIQRIGEYEILYYPGKWNFCENSFLGCHFTFFRGELSEWSSVSHKFIRGSM